MARRQSDQQHRTIISLHPLVYFSILFPENELFEGLSYSHLRNDAGTFGGLMLYNAFDSQYDTCTIRHERGSDKVDGDEHNIRQHDESAEDTAVPA